MQPPGALLALKRNIAVNLIRHGQNTHRHVSVKRSFEPPASGAQDELVDFPGAALANDGGVGEVAAFEKSSVGAEEAAIIFGWRHLAVLMW